MVLSAASPPRVGSRRSRCASRSRSPLPRLVHLLHTALLLICSFVLSNHGALRSLTELSGSPQVTVLQSIPIGVVKSSKVNRSWGCLVEGFSWSHSSSPSCPLLGPPFVQHASAKMECVPAEMVSHRGWLHRAAAPSTSGAAPTLAGSAQPPARRRLRATPRACARAACGAR